MSESNLDLLVIDMQRKMETMTNMTDLVGLVGVLSVFIGGISTHL